MLGGKRVYREVFYGGLSQGEWVLSLGCRVIETIYCDNYIIKTIIKSIRVTYRKI